MTRDIAVQLALGYSQLFAERKVPAKRCDEMPPPTDWAGMAHAHALIKDELHAWKKVVADLGGEECNLREAVGVAQYACCYAGVFRNLGVIKEQWRTGVIDPVTVVK